MVKLFMTCKSCQAMSPFTASYKMNCRDCVVRWINRLSSEEHKRMVVTGLKVNLPAQKQP
jgi:hypothetical protein